MTREIDAVPPRRRPWYLLNIQAMLALLMLCWLLEKLGAIGYQQAAQGAAVVIGLWLLVCACGAWIAFWRWRPAGKLGRIARRCGVAVHILAGVALAMAMLVIASHLPRWLWLRKMDRQGVTVLVYANDAYEQPLWPDWYRRNIDWLYRREVVGNIWGIELGPQTTPDLDLTFCQSLTHLSGFTAKNYPLRDQDLAPLAKVTTLEWVVLEGTEIRGPGLRHLTSSQGIALLSIKGPIKEGELMVLGQFPQLSSLHLLDCEVRDDDLQHLAHLQRLQLFYLDASHLDGSGFAHLKNVQVILLSLRDAQFSEDGWRNVAQLTSLYSLHAAHSNCDDRALQHLARNPTLVRLMIEAAPITDAGIAHWKNHPTLTEFCLEHTAVGDEGCHALATCKSLRRIDAPYTNITAVGAQRLLSMPSLVSLDLSHTKVTREDVASFKLPKWLHQFYLRGLLLTPDDRVFLARQQGHYLEVKDDASPLEEP